MIPSYTQYEFSMLSGGDKYLLPIEVLHPQLTDEEVFQKTLEWFQRASTRHAEWRSTTRTEYDTILIKYFYEGYDEWYPFEIELKLARFKKDPTDPKPRAIPDGCPVLELTVLQSYTELFHELLDLNVLPRFLETKKMKSYYTF